MQSKSCLRLPSRTARLLLTDLPAGKPTWIFEREHKPQRGLRWLILSKRRSLYLPTSYVPCDSPVAPHLGKCIILGPLAAEEYQALAVTKTAGSPSA